MPIVEAKVFRFGIFEADVRSGELRKNGSKIRLQEQPFQVLAALLERPGDVVTREELRQRLWPADTFVDFDHSLNTAINKLREALGDSATSPRFIETLARRGYRFLAPVQVVTPNLPTAPQVAVPLDTPRPPSAAECAVAVAAAEKPTPEEHELPSLDRGIGRALFGLIQLMYLIFYVVGLAKLHAVERIADRSLGAAGWLLVAILIVSALVGIPVRLYLFTAVAFDYRKLSEKFRRLFPALLPLDQLWALSPFLVVEKIGLGLALAATAALLYLPFSQRTLIRMTYDRAQNGAPYLWRHS